VINVVQINLFIFLKELLMFFRAYECTSLLFIESLDVLIVISIAFLRIRRRIMVGGYSSWSRWYLWLLFRLM